MKIEVDVDKYIYTKLFKEQIAPTLQDLDKCFYAIKNGKVISDESEFDELYDKYTIIDGWLLE